MWALVSSFRMCLNSARDTLPSMSDVASVIVSAVSAARGIGSASTVASTIFLALA